MDVLNATFSCSRHAPKLALSLRINRLRKNLLHLFSPILSALCSNGPARFIASILVGFQLLWSCNTVLAQNYLYEFKKVLVDPSFTDNRIFDVVQDYQGYIWLGTATGLYRFDGYSTERINYRVTASKEQEYVNKLALIGDNLFVGDIKGIHAINCTSYEPVVIEETPSGNIIGLIADASQGVWWLNENGLLTHFQNNKKRHTQLPQAEKIQKVELYLKEPQLWIATTYSVGHQTNLFNTTKFALENQQSLTTENEYVHSIREDLNGNIVLSASPNCYQWNQQSKTLLRQETSEGNRFDILYTNEENFTIVNEKEIYHNWFGKSGESHTPISTGAVKPEIIYKLYEINNCLFATSSNGLYIIKYSKNLFNTIFSTYDQKNNSFWVPRGITEDDEFIYLGTYSNLIQFNKSTLVSKIINEEPYTKRPLLKDNDTLWMGTEGGGIRKYQVSKTGNGRFLPDEIMVGATILCLAKMDDHRLIAGGRNCLFTYDKRTKTTTPIIVTSHGKNALDNRVNQITVLPNSEILLATESGTYKIDINGNILIDYTKPLEDRKDKITYAAIKCDESSIWIGTENGVFQLDEKGNILTHLNTKDGLAGNLIVSLVCDYNGKLWAASYTGLSCIDLKSKSITNYYKEDGLPDNEFNHSSFMLLRDSSIILGSVNGFVKFEPKALNFTKQAIASIHISKIESGSQQYQNTAFDFNNFDEREIKLGKGVNYVKINFCITPIDVFRNTQYEYKIEGIHSEWISLGNSPVLHIDNFKPGRYILSIRAITGSGSQHNIYQAYRLVVEEYFYKTYLFYLGVFMLICLLIFLYFNSLLKRNRKINDIRSHIAQDLHDEVGGYLTGITMNLELLHKKNDKIDAKHFTAIEILGQNALKSLKDSLWSLDAKSDTAQELWDRVKNMASETYEPLDIDYHFTQIVGLENIKLSMLQKSYLIHSIKECMTNSIKHGDKQNVQLSWQIIKGVHTVVISNKIGDKNKSSSKGNGLYNIQNRMDKINASVSFDTSDDVFQVSIQLNFLS